MAKLKEEKEEKESAKTIQHLFHVNKVEQKKREGWKVVRPHTDRHQQGGLPTDLVLMEK